eukprot:g14665.t1
MTHGGLLRLFGVMLLALVAGLTSAQSAPEIRPVGCFKDGPDPRIMGPIQYTSHTMAPAECATYCDDRGYSLAGVQYYIQCFCGNSYNPIYGPGICDAPCPGWPSTFCGGDFSMNVWSIVPGPVPVGDDDK